MNAPAEFMNMPVALNLIERSPTNPRETFDEGSLATLAESIKAKGVLQPVLLRPWPATYTHTLPMPAYEIVAGERRCRAARIAGLTDLPAWVRDLTDNEVLEIQIIENLQREDLHPIEEAAGYERMMADYGYTADSLAEKIGKSKAYVYARVKLCALCHTARKAFREGKLNPSTALLIARIPTEKLQMQACKEITALDWQGELMSYRKAKDHIHQRYMLRLVEAPFDTNDADLLKKVGSCMACPKRTGNQPGDLFSDVENGDVCTDPDCHQQKRTAHINRVAAGAIKEGKTVITGKAAEKIMPNNYTLSGHTKLDDKTTDKDGMYRSYRDILKDQELETVLIEDTKNKVLIETLPTKQLAIALKAAGVKTGNDNQREQQKETRVKVDNERAFRKELFSQTIAAIRDDYENGNHDRRHPDMRLVASALYHGLGYDTQAAFVKTKVEGSVNHEVVQAYADQIPLLAGLDLHMELIEMALCAALQVSEWSLRSEPEELIAMATGVGIDPKEVRKSLIPALKTSAKGMKQVGSEPKADKKAKKSTPAIVVEPLYPSEAAQAVKFDARDDEKTPEASGNGLTVGSRVRIRNDFNGTAAWKKAVCGKEGIIESMTGEGAYINVRIAPGKAGLVENLVWNELEPLLPAANAAQAQDQTQIETNETPTGSDAGAGDGQAAVIETKEKTKGRGKAKAKA